MSFQQLVDKYDLPRKYLQVRSFIYSQFKTTIEPTLSTIEQFMLNHPCGRDQLSKFYEVLLSESKENSSSYPSAWKNDLQVDISVKDWEKTCFQVQTKTVSNRGKLLHVATQNLHYSC